MKKSQSMSPTKKLSIGFLGLSLLYGGFVFFGQATAQEPAPRIALERGSQGGERFSHAATSGPATTQSEWTGSELSRLVPSLPGNDQLTKAGISLDSELYQSLKNYLEEYYLRNIAESAPRTETVAGTARPGTTSQSASSAVIRPSNQQGSSEQSADTKEADTKPAAVQNAQAVQKEIATTRLGQAVADLAKSLIGSPYRYGGESPSGFDSSGLVQYVFRKQGVDLPRRVSQQVKVGTAVSRSNLQIGDLVFFGNPKIGRAHV